MDIHKTILVVEDSEQIRCSLGEALLLEGCEVLAAASCIEAIGMLANARPAFIVLTVTMSEGNGHDFLEHLRDDSQRSQIPVILTPHADSHMSTDIVRSSLKELIDLYSVYRKAKVICSLKAESF